MEMITLNKENIEKEHICCAISSNNDIQVKTKKEWLLEQFDKGLVFTKMDVRGKCFIEYLPLENAWISLKGHNMMYIDCLWVAGKYQGLGYATALLDSCIVESKKQERNGIVILSSHKKSPYLMDYKFLIKHGFKSVDKWGDVELMYYSLNDDTEIPMFNIAESLEDGLVIYYTSQCPFNAKYTQILKDHCQNNNIPLKFIHIQSQEEALKAPTPLTTYSFFYNHRFITREVLTINKFDKIWGEINE
ncbi:MAG: GNAT family N-acetyltransferase [Coprobacillus sp.]